VQIRAGNGRGNGTDQKTGGPGHIGDSGLRDRKFCYQAGDTSISEDRSFGTGLDFFLFALTKRDSNHINYANTVIKCGKSSDEVAGVLFIGFKKYLVVLFFIMIYASSPAGAHDLGLSSDLPMHPTNEFTSKSADLENQDAHISSVSESLEETVAITLHKRGDQIIWSLAPLPTTITLNPIDDIRNIQVLLRFRF
jgi:hypothetical protein